MMRSIAVNILLAFAAQAHAQKDAQDSLTKIGNLFDELFDRAVTMSTLQHTDLAHHLDSSTLRKPANVASSLRTRAAPSTPQILHSSAAISRGRQWSPAVFDYAGLHCVVASGRPRLPVVVPLATSKFRGPWSVQAETEGADKIDDMSIQELRDFIKSKGLSSDDCLEKADLKKRALQAVAQASSQGPGPMPGGLPGFNEESFKAAANTWSDPKQVEAAKNFMNDPARMADMKKAMSNPDFQKQAMTMAGVMMKNKDMQAKMKALKNDPSMQNVINDIKQKGPGELFKYYNDPNFISKVSEVMGDTPAQVMQDAKKAGLDFDAMQRASGAAEMLSGGNKVESMTQKMLALREDPELGPIFNKIDKGGPDVMAKQFEDPVFYKKVVDKVGEDGARALKLASTTANNLQKDLASLEFEGYSSDETVRVVFTGQGEPTECDITETAHALGPEELGKRITEAMKDAYSQSAIAMREKTQNLAADLGYAASGAGKPTAPPPPGLE